MIKELQTFILYCEALIKTLIEKDNASIFIKNLSEVFFWCRPNYVIFALLLHLFFHTVHTNIIQLYLFTTSFLSVNGNTVL